MKKHKFASLHLHNKQGKYGAEWHDGYTDGVYNYYKGVEDKWFAVHPTTGLSVACADTLKQVAILANDAQTVSKIEAVLADKGDELKARFEEMFSELRIGKITYL